MYLLCFPFFEVKASECLIADDMSKEDVGIYEKGSLLTLLIKWWGFSAYNEYGFFKALVDHRAQ